MPIDPAQFGAAILNLAANARDAMNRSGRLTIRTQNIATAAGERARSARRRLCLAFGDRYRMRACRRGVGESLRAVLHDEGGRQRHRVSGLSQVYGFAKQSGGAARIESEPVRERRCEFFCRAPKAARGGCGAA